MLKRLMLMSNCLFPKVTVCFFKIEKLYNQNELSLVRIHSISIYISIRKIQFECNLNFEPI